MACARDTSQRYLIDVYQVLNSPWENKYTEERNSVQMLLETTDEQKSDIDEDSVTNLLPHLKEQLKAFSVAKRIMGNRN